MTTQSAPRKWEGGEYGAHEAYLERLGFDCDPLTEDEADDWNHPHNDWDNEESSR